MDRAHARRPHGRRRRRSTSSKDALLQDVTRMTPVVNPIDAAARSADSSVLEEKQRPAGFVGERSGVDNRQIAVPPATVIGIWLRSEPPAPSRQWYSPRPS